MRNRLTIAQAARALEVSESVIRYAIESGKLPILPERSSRRQRLMDPEEVALYGRQRRLGRFDRSFRHVAVTGFDESSEVVVALRAAGLHVELGSSVMEALSTHHDRYGNTILVAPVALPEQDRNLLRIAHRDVHMIFVGDQAWLDTILASYAEVFDEWDLRGVVQAAWRLVESRS